MHGALAPVRETIRQVVDRFSHRDRVDYRRLLQNYSRVLTAPTTLSELLITIAGQVEEVFGPAGLAIALGVGGEGYQVVHCRGELSSQALWQEGSHFSPTDRIPAQLEMQSQPFYLPRHIYNVPEEQRQEWQRLLRSGVHLFAPLRAGDILCGWLVLGPRSSGQTYTRQDLGFLSALMDQSCVALENARLYGEMRQRATELALVAMVSSAISSSLELEQVLETIVESVIQVIGCDKSAIFEVSEDGARLSLRMARGLSAAYAEASRNLQVSESHRALALASGQPLIVPDIQTEPHLAELAGPAQQEGFRAVVDVPLLGRGGALGVLSVYFAQVYRPSTSELEILTTFASQAAIAIENARLYAAVTRERDRARRLYEQTDAALARRVEELTTIGEISRQLTSTLDMQEVMDLMLQRALQATQARRGLIALYEPEQDFLQVLAQKGYPRVLDRYQFGLGAARHGITGRVALTGTAALVPDVSEDADYVAVAPTTRAQLSIPMIHEEQVVGVITLESEREAAFTEEHARFVGLLAEHAVIGINNAQLFRQVMEARDRLHAVLNSTHDLVLVLDTSGQIVLTNRRVREMFGTDVEEWLRSVGLPGAIQVLDSQALPFAEVDVRELVEVLRRARDFPEGEVDIAFSFQDEGRRRYIEGTGSPMLSAAGEMIGWVTVMREVTERKELELFREDLTSMVIHNLQGPLAALISSLETLQGDGQLDSQMAEELVKIALMSGQKLYSRIESLLWIRRLEERRMPLNLQAVSLWVVVHPIVDEYLPMATNAGIALETHLAQDLPPVIVDEEIIGRVFSNLLDNALKYVPEGGQVQVQASLERGPDGPVALCAVIDNGPGISQDTRDALFEKFRRGESVPQRRRKGMGLGLHYCKVAVEAHQGSIWVESQKGHGSTFYFTLPVVTDEQGEEWVVHRTS